MKQIAHRGGSGWRVENTLAAFAHAIDLGVAGAELDVHLSRDGKVVVHHDDTLNPGYCRRAAGGWINRDEAPALAALDYAALRGYEIGTPRPGSDYAWRFPQIQAATDQRIPLLRDVVELARERSDDFVLVVEIKADPLQAARQPWRVLVDETLDVIARQDFAARTILCSFDWGALRYAMRQWPGLPTWFTTSPLSWFRSGSPPAADIPPMNPRLLALRAHYATGAAPWFAGFDPRQFGGSHAQAVAAAGGRAWFPWHRDLDAHGAEELDRHGLDSAVWSVNMRDPDETRRLAHLNVTYLVTDYPAAGVA